MIGDEVRRRREELGLTGAQLATRAGMAPSAVSQIETGKRTPSSTSVLKLAAALGVEVGDLYPKGQAPLPLEYERLIDRAEVQEWLRGQGHMTEEEFLSSIPTLDEPGVEGAIRAVREKPDELIDALHTPEARRALFPVPRGISEEETRAWLLKPPGRWELAWEIRHEYSARELALVNYSRQLFVAGEAEDYHDLAYVRDPDLHEQLLERRRVLEAAYEKAKAA